MNTDAIETTLTGTPADAPIITRSLSLRHSTHVPKKTLSAPSSVASGHRLPQVPFTPQAVLRDDGRRKANDTGAQGSERKFSPTTGSQGGLTVEIDTPGSSHEASGELEETRTDEGALGTGTTSSARQWPVVIPYRPAPNRTPSTHLSYGADEFADELDDRANPPRRLRRITARLDARYATDQESSPHPPLTPTTLPQSEDIRSDRKRKRASGNDHGEPTLAPGTPDGQRRKLKPLTQSQRAERASKRGRVCLKCRSRKVKCDHVGNTSAEPVDQGGQIPMRARTSTRTLDLQDPSSRSLAELPSPVTPGSQRLHGEQSPSPVASLCDGIGALFHGVLSNVCPKCGRWSCPSLKIS